MKKRDIPFWHFCDNKEDANKCAELVLSGKKKATSPSIWELIIKNIAIPQKGDLNIITNWEGVAKGIIQTRSVKILRFDQITSYHARLEGEGDGSLEYWRKAHRSYYERVLKGSSYDVKDSMPIVFEQFELVYPH